MLLNAFKISQTLSITEFERLGNFYFNGLLFGKLTVKLSSHIQQSKDLDDNLRNLPSDPAHEPALWIESVPSNV